MAKPFCHGIEEDISLSEVTEIFCSGGGDKKRTES